MPKISIIVPVYNVEKYLKKCLDSLITQTLDDIEIIIVNDGTKDNSQQIIDFYVSEYPNKIKGYIKENGGLSSARNYGLQRAKSDYVAFVDSDDWVEPTMYEALYQKAMEHNFDLVMCDFNEIRKDKVQCRSCKLHQDIYNHEGVKQVMTNFYPSAWNKLFKKDLLVMTQTYFKEGVWFEDVEFIYRLLPYVNCIGIVNKCFYNYLIRKGSITATVDPRIFHYIQNWNGLVNFYKDRNLYTEYKDIIEYCYVRYLFATFVKAFTKADKKTYCKAIEAAIENVNNNFPEYKQNNYLNKGGLKNFYLKYFSKRKALFLYWLMHNRFSS
ncbi:MAG: glycosyltransferase [Erysipelotrichaceae bacterium]|nr:glycosyltransferase [Erysipelotrichaceae bacterium]